LFFLINYSYLLGVQHTFVIFDSYTYTVSYTSYTYSDIVIVLAIKSKLKNKHIDLTLTEISNYSTYYFVILIRPTATVTHSDT